MKGKRSPIIFAIVLIGTLMISQVTYGDQSSKIVGKWQLMERNDPKNASNPSYLGRVTEFFDDGTFSWLGLEQGRWSVLKDGRIKIDYDTDIIFPIFQEDKLIMEYNSRIDGKPCKEIYKRKKAAETSKNKAGNVEMGSYFPGKEGIELIMHYKNDMGGKKTEHRQKMISLAPQQLQGKNVFPIKQIYTYSKTGQEVSSFISYYAKDQEGVYRVASQRQLSGNPEKLKYNEGKSYILKNPIKSGNEWWYEINDPNSKLKIKAKIDSVGDMITVPAGMFEECIKVSKSGNGMLNDGTEFKNEIISWYAPGVGIVKSTTIEERNIRGKTIMNKMEGQLESMKN
jgi:hypothetical protein